MEQHRHRREKKAMSTKAMYDLKEMLCTDLDQYARKGSLTRNDLDTVHMITDTIKNLEKISMMGEEGYSYGDGNWTANGSYSNGRMPMSDGYSGRRGMSRREMDMDTTTSGRRYMRNNYSNDAEDMENRMRREMY